MRKKRADPLVSPLPPRAPHRGALAQAHLQHLRQFRPNQLQELQANGSLNQHLARVQEDYRNQLGALIEQGVPEDHARELVRDLLYPAPEPGWEATHPL